MRSIERAAGMWSNGVGRRGAAAFLVAVLVTGAAAVLGPAAPAGAAGSPRRFHENSEHNTVSPKSVTVDCPEHTAVFGTGGRTWGGGGGVVLTGIIPNPALTSVTVTAAARGGYSAAWSITAYAVCDWSARPAWREATTHHGARGATVDCPGPSELYGTGFRLVGGVNHAYLGAVSVDMAEHSVEVRSNGPGIPTSVTAFGICKDNVPAGEDPNIGIENTVAFDGTWPTVTSVTDTEPDHPVYGVGAQVRGRDDVFINALVPHVEQDTAIAGAVQATPLWGGPAGVSARLVGSADEEGSLTVEAVLGGTFH